MDRIRTNAYCALQFVANRTPYWIGKRLRKLAHVIRPPLPRMLAITHPATELDAPEPTGVAIYPASDVRTLRRWLDDIEDDI